MTYLADPGGRFASDTHRRVLGHLSLPADGFAWSVPALLARMVPDVGTDIKDADELSSVLEELEREGFAFSHSTAKGPAWQMTPQGFDVLTGSIANEPGPDSQSTKPAAIGIGPVKLDVPTEIPVEETDATDHPS